MFGRLLALFLIVPLVDLALLVAVGGRLGFVPTVAIVMATALAGSWLARREGAGAWRRLRARLASGGVPGPELIDGVLILLSGTLLLTPGFLTDLAGLLGLFPPTRRALRTALRQRFEKSVVEGRIRVVHGGPSSGAPSPFGGAPFGAPPFGVPRQAPIEDAEVIDDGRPPEVSA